MSVNSISTPTISVIIPAYNEASHIHGCLLETSQVLKDIPHEIIVVDDGSLDSTIAVVQAIAVENPRIQIHSLETNRGKGAALLAGCKIARGELISFLDADMELHPRLILRLWRTMFDGNADVVIGSKHHPASSIHYPAVRQVTSSGYATLISFLFNLGVRDTQTGIKLFKAEVIQQILPRLRIERFAFDLELLVAANRFGYTILEAPVEVQFRRPHGGRLKLRAILGMFVDTIKIFYWASFWKWLDPSLPLRIWMVLFVIGSITASFGFAHWLAIHVQVPQTLSRLAYYLTLRFLDTQARDWIMLIFGLAMMVLALVELNKGVLAAFARAERRETKGKLPTPPPPHQPIPPPPVG